MLEVGGDPNFLKKPISPKHGGQHRPKHLDRDLPLVLQVLGQIHRGHPSRAEFALEAVSVGKGGGQALQGLSQVRSRMMGYGRPELFWYARSAKDG